MPHSYVVDNKVEMSGQSLADAGKGVIAVVDFSGKIIAACSTYISTLKDAPNELFLIRAEVASLRDIVRTLDLPQGAGLPAAGNTASTQILRAPDGTLARCESCLKDLLELLVPRAAKPGTNQPNKPPSKPHKFAAFRLASLLSPKNARASHNQKLYDDLGWSVFDLAGWPTRQKKAKAFLGEIMQHKTTIILALEAESRSSIIQQLQLALPGRQQQLAYFYFDRDKKDMTESLDFLRATVAQLIQGSDMTEDDFINVFGPDGVAARDSFQAATPELLEGVVAAMAGTKKVVVVIDALDECEDIKTLLALIARLLMTKSVDILMSSRLSAPIKKAWGQLTTAHPGACHELALLPSMNKDDITTYVTQAVESMVSSGDLSLRNPGLHQEIIDTLKGKSDGMFQWAASHLRSLPAYCTDHDISEALKELPQGLEKTYESMIKQLTLSMPARNMRLCRRVFRMLLFAHRPLTLPELAVAVSIEPMTPNIEPSTILTDPQSVLALGGPLVVYKPETNLVEFSHHTVREYLESLGEDAGMFHFAKADEHAEIAGMCLSYIQSTTVMERLRTMTYADLHGGESDEGDLALVHYAAKYWIGHAQQTTTVAGKDKLTGLLYAFFFGQMRSFPTWKAVAEPPYNEWGKRRQLGGLEAELAKRAATSVPEPVMSALGSLRVARRRAAASAMAPLHLQRPGKESREVKLLLGSGSGGQSIASLHAFHYLARINHPQCLSLALPQGQPTLRVGLVTGPGGPLGTTTLHEAAKHGAYEFLEVLFQHLEAWKSQVDVNAADILGRTALFYASRNGHLRILGLLLGHGARMAQADWYGSTPLHEAVIHSHHAVVDRFLSARSKGSSVVNTADSSGETPLSKACRFGDNEMVVLLALHSNGRTVIGAVRACLLGGTRPEVLEILVGTCAARSWGPADSPLQELVREGEAGPGVYGRSSQDAPSRSQVFETLLSHGYVVDLEDSDGATALTYALRHGQEAMSLRLLERGAQWSRALRSDRSPGDMGSMFMKAVSRGGFKLALLLLEEGAAWDAVDASGDGFIDAWAAQVGTTTEKCLFGYATPGIVAAATEKSTDGHPKATDALQLLQSVLQRGMDINRTNTRGRTLLHLLSSSMTGWNNEGIPELRWILDHGGDASVRDARSMTPLHCLCENANVLWTEELGEVFGLLARAVRGSINQCVSPDGTTLHILVQSSFGSGRLPEFVTYALDHLLEAGASPEACNERGETPLAMALDALLRDPEWSGQNRRRLLSAASRLASRDKTANALPSDSGDRIVRGLFAIFGGDEPSLAYLLTKLNLTPSQTVTALGRTTNPGSLKMLIDAGADANARSDSGWTPLHMQAWTNGVNLCSRLEVLLEAGADPNALSNSGESVLDILRETIHVTDARATDVGTTDLQIEGLLLRYGAKLTQGEASHWQ
ncbi:ankyrin repeat-containing domain protein [Achaetomium macrosporum]|uniref:Ankyrin repeat-containing domain protein n=1 Tax=Achaetomium macrosporum TaxID=79813 RepID=A0AAN7C0I7_9PEZI|nr:ankyrin repeat-containing domain protein [Achaetomium macrosporum]